jgi:RHS repeat-associated protein
MQAAQGLRAEGCKEDSKICARNKDLNGPLFYDLEGNRTQVNQTSYQTGSNNQLQSDGVWNYTYDAEGNEAKKVNVSSGVAWTYGYDNANHLTVAQQWSKDPALPGATLQQEVDYKYDVFGGRIEKGVYNGQHVAQAITRFVLDGPDVYADLDGLNNNALLMRYVHGDQTDQLLARETAAGAVAWYLTDARGSVRGLVDGSGTLQDTLNYDAYGQVTTETNPSYSGRYGWTGREREAETGLQYNRARYYDPATGRWISQDPDGFDAGDSNLYRYVNNSPTVETDPTGLQVTQDFLNTVGGPGTLIIRGWGYKVDEEWLKVCVKINKGGEAWPQPVTSYADIKKAIDDAYRNRGNKPFNRIILIGHAGIGDGINKHNGPGFMLGDASKDGPGKPGYTGRFQLADYYGKKYGHFNARISFPGLDDSGLTEELKKTLKRALTPTGVLQLASCGYQTAFDKEFKQQGMTWIGEIQKLANALDVTIAVVPNPAGPGVKITTIEEGGFKFKKREITGRFDTHGTAWIITSPKK